MVASQSQARASQPSSGVQEQTKLIMNPSDALLKRHAPATPVAGCPEISVHQAPDIFTLWLAWEAESNTLCDVPYWAIVWPAAQALSQYIIANPSLVKGKSVLDCGCGGGVVAITAAKKKAVRSVGCDMDQTAIGIAQRNAEANAVMLGLECRDVVEFLDPDAFDLILVADLFYQKEFSSRLLSALRNALSHGCDVIIADSGRPFLPKGPLVEIHCQTAATSFDVEGCLSRTVRLYRFRE